MYNHSRRRVSDWDLLHLQARHLGRPGCRISLQRVVEAAPLTLLPFTGMGSTRLSSSVICKTSTMSSNARSGLQNGHVRLLNYLPPFIQTVPKWIHRRTLLMHTHNARNRM